MIIFGTTVTRKLLDQGQFNCPQCQADANYEKRRAKQWGHLYWIPIIPMQEHPPYVECKSCRATFIDRVLEQSGPTQAQFDIAATKIMASIVLADGEVEEAELDMCSKVMSDLLGRSVDRAEVDQIIAEAKETPEDPVEIGQTFGPFLNAQGSEVVLRSAVLIAVSDGDFAPEEQKMVGDVGVALGMTGAHIRGVIEDVLAAMSAPTEELSVH